jgi:hypothetical protein
MARFIATKDRNGLKVASHLQGKPRRALGWNYVKTTVSLRGRSSRILVFAAGFRYDGF